MFMGQVVTAFAPQQGQTQTINISQQPPQQQQQVQQQQPRVTAMQPGQAPLAQHQTQFLQVTHRGLLKGFGFAFREFQCHPSWLYSRWFQLSKPKCCIVQFLLKSKDEITVYISSGLILFIFPLKAPRLFQGNQSTQLILQAAFPLQQQGTFTATTQQQQQHHQQLQHQQQQ